MYKNFLLCMTNHRW